MIQDDATQETGIWNIEQEGTILMVFIIVAPKQKYFVWATMKWQYDIAGRNTAAKKCLSEM